MPRSPIPGKLQSLAFSLIIILVASCADAPEVFSPSSSVTMVGPGAIASSRSDKDDNDDKNKDDKKQDDTGDEIPDNMTGVARYKPASNSPGARSVSAVFGVQGGSLRLGDFEMVVPAGAVTTDTRFSITTFSENGKKHAVASFLPHRTFAKAITLRVPLSSTESANDPDAHVMWLDKSDWVPLPSSVTADGRLETRTFHFSMYGTQYRGFTLVGG